jgi:anti-sigma B factor antagonist
MTLPSRSFDNLAADTDGDPIVVSVAGDIDMTNSDTLRVRFVEALDSGEGPLVIDMSDVTFFASSGIAALAHAREHSARLGGRPVHVVVSRSVERALRATAMDTILPLHATLDEALLAAKTQHR